MGRITPEQAERLLRAWNESRETGWILAACFGFAALAQFRLHDLVPLLRHFISVEVPGLMHMAGVVTGGMGGLL